MSRLRLSLLGALLWASASTAAGTPPKLEEATFAGGCFWSMELAFHGVPGVVSVTAGFTGGQVASPSYEEVSRGSTGHVEAVDIQFDPAKVTYAQLLDAFWHNVDPLNAQGQFCDDGPEYRSEIFAHGDAQRRAAEASREAIVSSHRFKDPVVTKIVPAGPFYPAEGYHQDFARKHADQYKPYHDGCGRDRRLLELWGPSSPSDAVHHAQESCPMKWKQNNYLPPAKTELKSCLSPQAYTVTQEDGTERAFQNAFWDNHEPGLYVDVVSGEPLFSSTDKFDSGTGWPSFTQAVEGAHVKEKKDASLLMERTEVRSAKANSHLGHLFDDGPGPTGLRYCINSASLRFVPVAKLQEEGYGAYLKLFEKDKK